ncbi:MAG: helix-turn-helix transcriptional regulator [Planctomycetes bacterium]|nr:helix-turn-helix transcriptional regulator [Planctomycetota bacterium]
MKNLPLFVRMIRESQGITQKEIAEAAKISQSAIAQYEKLQAALSLETLLKIAPLLNLNPEYIRTGIGNPFKQADEKKIIKMFMPENPLGEIDFSLIDFIAESNQEATFLLLHPVWNQLKSDIFKKIHSMPVSKKYAYCYALLVEDGDNNKFLFRRKNKGKILESEPDWFIRFDRLNKEPGKYFEIRIIKLTKHLFNTIENWSYIDNNELSRLLKSDALFRYRIFLTRLIKEIWSHKTMKKNKKEGGKILEIIMKLQYEDIDRLIALLIPEFAEIIKKHLH